MLNIREFTESTISEEVIDANLDGSFPASDPPSWTLGVDHGRAKADIAPSATPEQRPCLLSRPVTESDHLQGAATAPVVLLMYGAYECVYCVKGNDVVKQLRREFGGDLRFAFRHFPHFRAHPHAVAAAEVAEAAGEQDKFWEMHDKLFENHYRLDGLHLVLYAKSIGLDMKCFHHAITNRIFAQRVQEDLISGMESGVKGTPAYFINGVKHTGSSEFSVLAKAVEEAAELEARSNGFQYLR